MGKKKQQANEHCPICDKADNNKESGPFGVCGPHMWIRGLYNADRRPAFELQPVCEAAIGAEVAGLMNAVARLTAALPKEADTYGYGLEALAMSIPTIRKWIMEAYLAGLANGAQPATATPEVRL